jgi:hypothetical protein
MEGLASKTGLLPEQSWDEADRPDIFMWLGQPTGWAMRLMWSHAEYIKLLRSTKDVKVYDTIPEVAKRYLGKREQRKRFEIWKKPVTPDMILKKLIRPALERAGITEKVIGWCSFRHWLATNLRAAGSI